MPVQPPRQARTAAVVSQVVAVGAGVSGQVPVALAGEAGAVKPSSGPVRTQKRRASAERGGFRARL